VAVAAAPGSLRTDPRLTKGVTLHRPRVYLGELLAEVSRQVGVRCSLEPAREPASGMELAVFVTDRPAHEVLQGLETLYTTPFNRWEWQAAPERGYRLRAQHSVAEGSRRARAAVAEELARDIRDLHRIAGLPDAAREAEAGARPHLFGRPPQVLHGLLDAFRSVPAGELDAALRGAFAPVDVERAGERGRAAMSFGVSGGGRPEGAPPRRAGLFLRALPTTSHMPVLWLQKQEGVAFNLAGGGRWDRLWYRRHSEGWRCRADEDVEAFRERRARNDPLVGRPLRGTRLTEWLEGAAGERGLPFVADLVMPGGRTGLSPWLGRTGEQTILALTAGGHVLTRAEGLCWLVRDETAFLDPRAHLVDWETIRGLRASCARNEGFATLADLVRLAQLSPEQGAGLSEEFGLPATFEAWQGVLSFYRNLTPEAQRRLVSRDGLPFPEAGLLARTVLLDTPDPRGVGGTLLLRERARDAVVHFRLEKHEEPDAAGAVRRTRRLVWEVRLPDRRPHLAMLGMRAHRPLGGG